MARGTPDRVGHGGITNHKFSNSQIRITIHQCAGKLYMGREGHK